MTTRENHGGKTRDEGVVYVLNADSAKLRLREEDGQEIGAHLVFEPAVDAVAVAARA